MSDQFFHCFVEDLVVYKDISILHALYVWYVFNKLSLLNKDFIIIIIIIITVLLLLLLLLFPFDSISSNLSICVKL